MEFEDRLRRAIERGTKTRDDRGRAELERELTLEELKTLHTQYRLAVLEYLETGLKKLADHLPGFKFQSVMNEDGWGGRLSRDDLHLVPGKSPESRYSRLEMLISPFTPSGILELVIKGAVRNREVMNRKHYQKLSEFDRESFLELIDLRILEFAEIYSATS
ncbi:MAG TPA: hypothetical protein VNQ76_08215 [Planctomicrobium sp.]|nr:hypothetical protein [Planctomicrobium sp.]